MSIRIAKGYPISFLVTVKQDGTPININDGTWTYDVSLHYQTAGGTIPFALTTIPSGNSVQINISNTQTSTLDHKSTGYVLCINCSKIDSSAFISNDIAISVTNGL